MNLSRERRILGLVLMFAMSVWGLDSLTSKGEALANRMKEVAPLLADGAPEWENVDSVIQRLTEVRADAVEADISGSERDLFTPTMLLRAALEPVGEPEEDEEVPPEVVEVDPVRAFSESHKLNGVLLGRTPLAVIDGELMAEGSAFGDFHLVQIGRDDVTFRYAVTGERVRLPLTRPVNRAHP